MNRKKVAICCTLNAVIKKICDVDLIYMNLKVYMNLLIIYMMVRFHHEGSINLHVRRYVPYPKSESNGEPEQWHTALSFFYTFGAFQQFGIQGAPTGRIRDTDSQVQTLTATVGVSYYIRKYTLGSSISRFCCCRLERTRY